MFRAKRLLALSLLGLLALTEAGVALWAQRSAVQQVQRGRLTSDILKGYIELSANKQRLRSWAAQRLLADSATDTLRDGLLQDMQAGLAQLHALAGQLDLLEAALQEPGRREIRQRSLDVLERHLLELGRALKGLAALPPGTDATQASQRLRSLFDESQGQDLRRLLNAEMEAERLATSQSRQAADQALRAIDRGVTWLSAGALMLTLALLAYFAWALRQPLNALMRGARALREGDLGYRIPAQGRDEFGELARSFNQMAGELQQHRAQEQADRALLEDMVQARTAELRQALDTLQALDARRRRFFAELSHELRTPATAIRGEAEVALRGGERPAQDYREALQRIVDTVGQFSHVLGDLSQLARSEVEALAMREDLLAWPPLLARSCEQAAVLARAAQLRFDWQLGPANDAARLRGDAQRLSQALAIVLDNARRYSRPGGAIRLQAVEEGGQLRIDLLDEGIGVAEQELPQVFDRLFRGEAARAHRPDGLGLGLAIARDIVQAHGGDIALSNRETPGCHLRLSLPLVMGGIDA